MNILKILSLVLLILCKLNVCAQMHSIRVSKICSFSPSVETDKACQSEIEIGYTDMSPNDTLLKSVRKVLSLNVLKEDSMAVGILDNLLISGMYCKPQSDLKPRLLIGKRYIGDYWVAMGILLHELGHLLNHHENICSNAQLESDADLFAGRCLAVLKATKEEAVRCLNLVTSAPDLGHQYPVKEQRLKDILTGYNNFLNSIGVQSFTSINPLVRWKWIDDDGHYEVYINRDTVKILYSKYYAVFDKGAIDPVQGILYLSAANSTYQLINLTNRGQGMGQLVNDRTPLVYKRFGKNSYRLYNKAHITTTKDVKDTIKSDDPKDYEILYKESLKSPSYSRVVFVDYFFTPNDILRPAFFK